MKKIAITLAALTTAIVLSACGQKFEDSPQHKAFEKFAEHCKQTNDASQECKDYHAPLGGA